MQTDREKINEVTVLLERLERILAENKGVANYSRLIDDEIAAVNLAYKLQRTAKQCLILSGAMCKTFGDADRLSVESETGEWLGRMAEEKKQVKLELRKGAGRGLKTKRGLGL